MKRIWLATWACAGETLSNESEVWSSALGCLRRSYGSLFHLSGVLCSMTRRWWEGGWSECGRCGLAKSSSGPSSGRSVRYGFNASTVVGTDLRGAVRLGSLRFVDPFAHEGNYP